MLTTQLRTLSSHLKYAGVAELADALGLGPSAARRGGSSPFTRTTADVIYLRGIVAGMLRMLRMLPGLLQSTAANLLKSKGQRPSTRDLGSTFEPMRRRITH